MIMRGLFITLLTVLTGAGPLCLAAAESGNPQAELGPGMVNPGYHEKPDWFKNSFLDIREDIEEAAAAGKRVILYFYQDGCPYCKKLLEVNFASRDIAEKTREQFDVIAINMWGDREVTDLQGQQITEKQFATDLRVMFTPTLLFLNESGEVAMRVNGYYAPHRFMAALNYVSSGAYADSSFRDYVEKHGPAPAQGSLHQDPGYLQPPYRLDARKSDRPLLVMFEQADCAPCDELHMDILKRPQSVELLKQYDVVLLDMWAKTPVVTPQGKATTAADWARELKVQYAPTLVLFTSGGEEAFRAEAYLKAFHIQSSLDYVLSGAYKTQPSFQRYLQARAEEMATQGAPVDIMN